MNLAITIIAHLMIIDSLFALANINKFEHFLNKFFPKLNVKKLAIIEGAVGLIIIVIKIATRSVT